MTLLERMRVVGTKTGQVYMMVDVSSLMFFEEEDDNESEYEHADDSNENEIDGRTTFVSYGVLFLKPKHSEFGSRAIIDFDYDDSMV